MVREHLDVVNELEIVVKTACERVHQKAMITREQQQELRDGLMTAWMMTRQLRALFELRVRSRS